MWSGGAKPPIRRGSRSYCVSFCRIAKSIRDPRLELRAILFPRRRRHRPLRSPPPKSPTGVNNLENCCRPGLSETVFGSVFLLGSQVCAPNGPLGGVSPGLHREIPRRFTPPLDQRT